MNKAVCIMDGKRVHRQAHCYECGLVIEEAAAWSDVLMGDGRFFAMHRECAQRVKRIAQATRKATRKVAEPVD